MTVNYHIKLEDCDIQVQEISEIRFKSSNIHKEKKTLKNVCCGCSSLICDCSNYSGC